MLFNDEKNRQGGELLSSAYKKIEDIRGNRAGYSQKKPADAGLLTITFGCAKAYYLALRRSLIRAALPERSRR